MAKPIKGISYPPRTRKNQPADRRVRVRFSFACEGSTEVRYFTQALRVKPFDNALAVTAKAGKGSDAKSLISKAEELERMQGTGKHHVWIVCDKDFRPEQERQELQEWLDGKPKRNVVRKIAHSNLCLEYWLLLYCINAPAQHQKPDEYVADLTRELPGYSKEKRSKLPSELLDIDRLARAIDRCQKRQAATGFTKAQMKDQLEMLWNTRNLSNISEVFDDANGIVDANRIAGVS